MHFRKGEFSMGKIKLAIIGTGLRGAYTYAPLIEKYKDKCEIVAFVENKKGRRDLFLEKYPTIHPILAL